MSARLLECIEVADTLGEGVLWRPEDQTVWWTDIHGRRLHRLAWPSLDLATFPTPERVGSFAFVEGRDDVVLAAFETGFALFAPEDGRVAWLDRPEELGDGVRLNDGRVDPRGRFWAGSMMERRLAAGEQPRGVLYRLGPEGRAEPVLGGVRISNSICWSPRADRMYFADTPLGETYAAAYDARCGAPARFSVLARYEGEWPDGAVTDVDGHLWTAMWGGGRVARMTPEGEEIASIAIDAQQPTCPAFGGPAGNLLFVTTATQGLSDEQRAAKPRSGALFVFETEAKGSLPTRARLAGPAGRF
jgi:sugar lactone lactonase YvrE